MTFLEKLFRPKRFKTYRNEGERYLLEVPAHWDVASITQEYGTSFSDGKRQEGMLSVKPVLAPGSTLTEYADALKEAMQKEMQYTWVADADTQVGGHAAKEMVFRAPAQVDGKKKGAILTVTAVDESKRFRFIVLSYSVLENDYEKYIDAYTHAKKSFRIL